ncbi:MAG: PQQ-binding-like beta-propeller repeat protein [Pirellulaceae bacterium]
MSSPFPASDSDPQESAKPEADEASEGRHPVVPPAWIWLVPCALVVVSVMVQYVSLTGDNAVTNIVTLVCLLIAVLIPGIWFVFFSGFPRWVRTGTAVAAIGAPILAFVLFPIDHVSGELIPSFRFRWSRAPDPLPVPLATSEDADRRDLADPSPFDFPQFLGPQRNARVEGVELSRDWEARPPHLVWRQAIGAGWSAFAAARGLAVTLEQRGAEELVSCYELDTGNLRWAHATHARHETFLGGAGPRGTPTIDGDRVFALGAVGDLHCLELQTGRLIWHENLLERYGLRPENDTQALAWGRSGSPLVVDDLVVVPAGGPAGGPYVSLAAFDRGTGQFQWEAGQTQIGYASPILTTLADVRQIVSVNESNVTGHDPATGVVLWEASWPGSSTANANCSQPVPVGQQQLLVSKGYTWGAALLQIDLHGQKLAPRQVWHNRTLLKTKFTNLVVHSGHAYGLSDGTLECVNIAAGERRWKRGRYGQGQILGVGALLLVLSEDGELALVEASPEAYRELGRFPALEGKTWNNLCLVEHKLLIRNAAEAACYELP